MIVDYVKSLNGVFVQFGRNFERVFSFRRRWKYSCCFLSWWNSWTTNSLFKGVQWGMRHDTLVSCVIGWCWQKHWGCILHSELRMFALCKRKGKILFEVPTPCSFPHHLYILYLLIRFEKNTWEIWRSWNVLSRNLKPSEKTIIHCSEFGSWVWKCWTVSYS